MKAILLLMLISAAFSYSADKPKSQAGTVSKTLSEFERAIPSGKSADGKEALSTKFLTLANNSSGWDAEEMFKLTLLGFSASKVIGLDGCDGNNISSESLVGLLRRAFEKNPKVVRKKLTSCGDRRVLNFVKDRYSLQPLLKEGPSKFAHTKWNYANGLYEWHLYFDAHKVTYTAPNNMGLDKETAKSLSVSGKYEQKKDGTVELIFSRNPYENEQRTFTGTITDDHQLETDGLGTFREGASDPCAT